jgi:hypothetical protein
MRFLELPFFTLLTPACKLVAVSHGVLLLRHTLANWKTYFSLLEHSVCFELMLTNVNLSFLTKMKPQDHQKHSSAL